MPRLTKEDAERLLGSVPEQCPFFVCDGGVLRSMEELSAALRRMDSGTYSFHANKEKNDFSNWVRDIIGDEKLAKDLEKSRNKTSAAKKVAARIQALKAKK